MRYQFIGRRRKVDKIQTPKYKSQHIHSLPLEILNGIFSYLEDDIVQLVNVSYVCRRFHTIICRTFLYKSISFKPNQFLRFTHAHLPNKRNGVYETSTYVNMIREIEIVNPPIRDSQNNKTQIAGSYEVESNSGVGGFVSFSEFVSDLTVLMKEDFNLRSITLSEISPQFLFPNTPEESHSILKRSKKPIKRRLERLVIKAQNGWSILFKINHIVKILEIFDTIGELELHNFIIDETRLVSSQLPLLVTINNLTFNSCSFTNRDPKKHYCSLFKDTSGLRLLNLSVPSDLSIIDLVKRSNQLTSLSLDTSSKLFYEKDSFNIKGFNPFFKLLCSKQGSFCKLRLLVLENFDLLHQYNHEHGRKDSPSLNDEDLEQSNTLTGLLNNLSSIPYLIIRVKETPRSIRICKKCGFLETEDVASVEELSYSNWRILLWPLINNKTRFKIINYRGNTLFEVNFNT